MNFSLPTMFGNQAPPSITRQTVTNALWTLAQTASGFEAFNKRLAFWGQTTVFPALTQRYLGEHRAPLDAYGIPQATTLKYEWWVYARSTPSDPDPAATIQPLLDALDSALLTNITMDGRQTLGLEGFVTHAWIEGEINVSLGENDDAGNIVAIVPVQVQVNARIAAAS